MYEHKEIVFKN